MAGLYFHTPFCKRICAYCDFPRTTKLELMESYIPALHRELEQRRDYLTDRDINTIYFGGGTPSLYHPATLQGLIDHARTIFGFGELEEITIECNPDDMTEEYIAQLRTTEINRISIGVQSFNDDWLKLMGRRHTAQQAIDAIQRAQRAGFDNITIDLIFGVDSFGGDILRHSFDVALSLGVQHISAYNMTVEQDTPLSEMIIKGELKCIDEEEDVKEFNYVHDTLTAAGFEHYEVSNYALPGRRARHNSSYWSSNEYMGVGPGAHSLSGTTRCWCDLSFDSYFTKPFYEIDELTEQDQRNEYIMTRLRTVDGINIQEAETRFGADFSASLLAYSSIFIKEGVMNLEDGRLYIPAHKFIISNFIIRTYFNI